MGYFPMKNQGLVLAIYSNTQEGVRLYIKQPVVTSEFHPFCKRMRDCKSKKYMFAREKREVKECNFNKLSIIIHVLLYYYYVLLYYTD